MLTNAEEPEGDDNRKYGLPGEFVWYEFRIIPLEEEYGNETLVKLFILIHFQYQNINNNYF